VRILYQPPDQRLLFPGGLLDFLSIEVGLLDFGTGLHAYRQVVHCNDASCADVSPTGIAFTDPPGFAALATALQRGVPAAYETPYAAPVSLDETTGVFHWTIAGGAFGTSGVSGSADPAAYLAATPGWSGIPLAGAGFWVAQMAVTSRDTSDGGGGDAAIEGLFDDVHVGLDNAAATPFDDFSGSGGNSGLNGELSLAKWSPGGHGLVGPSGGSLGVASAITNPGATSAGAVQAMSLGDPASVNAIQADVRIASCSVTGPGTGGCTAGVQGRFYNDGTTGGAPDSAVGDILAAVFLPAGDAAPNYSILRCTTPTCAGGLPTVASGTLPGVTVGTGVHAVRVQWNPGPRTFTFAVDGSQVTVDPTGTAPYAGPANAPLKRILGTAISASGATASADVRFNNVFVGP
jgi:hypothetical protein